MNPEDARPEGANDPSVSSRAKDALFGEPVRDKTGRFTSKTEPVFQEPIPAEVSSDGVIAPPERHESGSYEQDQSDVTEEGADFETEEFYQGE